MDAQRAAAAGPAGAAAPDSAFGPEPLDPGLDDLDETRWAGWRLGVLLGVALLAVLVLLLFTRWVAATPYLDTTWVAGADGEIRLQATPLAALQAQRGRALIALEATGAADPARLPATPLLLQRSPRWQVDDEMRARQVAQHEALAAMLAAGQVALHFEGGATVTLPPAPRGIGGVGLPYSLLALLALALVLAAAAVVLERPQPRSALFVVMALSQAGSLLFIGLETLPGLSAPAGAVALDLPLRVALDAATGAAVVHAFALHPRRLHSAALVAGAAWGLVALWLLAAAAGLLDTLPGPWWWAQGLCLGLGMAALAVVSRSARGAADPYAAVMQRFAVLALATLGVVTLAVAAAARAGVGLPGLVIGASVAWTLFICSLLLLTPFLARSRRPLREFALLAGIATIATSLDLLLVALFGLGPFTALAIAVLIGLALYAGARRFLMKQVLGDRLPSTERIFEQLYRAARALQAQPGQYPRILAQLLGEVFDPLQVQRVERVPARARIAGGGVALVVPVQPLQDAAADASTALALRYAQRGRRLFTDEDARLAERMVDQLRRAVAHDLAVERGRTEERLRIAQDLHDDIGARLLTLMYQAPTPEMEDYLRHTLQDLKTLTRGLAAAEHRLSHAAAEWKADLTQRLTPAQVELGWAFGIDRELRLSVVQWSALTRVLRELVSNALYHGHATRIDVRLTLERGTLELVVADDGGGRDPAAWSHGLGLGGVRKRVKLLGGQVAWRENAPRGIVCEVRVPAFSAPPAAA